MSLLWEGGGIVDRFKLKDCIGRKLICDDGVPRLVNDIVYSHRFKDRAVINETDPDTLMGDFIHLLSLSCQMLGLPLPTEEQRVAFSNYATALYYEGNQDPFHTKWLNTLKTLRQAN